MAASLIKRLHFLEDRDRYRYELCYIRDKEGHEVDYAEHLKLKKAVQIIEKLRRPYDKGRFKIVDPITYFRKQI